MTISKLDKLANWACSAPRIEVLYEANIRNHRDGLDFTRRGFVTGYRARQQKIWRRLDTPFHAVFGTGKAHACLARARELDGAQVARGVGLFGLTESVTLYPVATMAGIIVGGLLGALVLNPRYGAAFGGVCGLTIGVAIGTTLREAAALLSAGVIFVLIAPLCAWSGLQGLPSSRRRQNFRPVL